MDTTERPTTFPVRWELDFELKLGDTATRFFAGLRECRILGTRCGECGWVYVPAQAYCERCMARTTDWEEVSPTGTIDAYSVVHRAPGGPPPPFVIATIRLDGADGLLLHHVGGIDPADVRPGLRVRAVWEEQRRGHILDILHFAPLSDET